MRIYRWRRVLLAEGVNRQLANFFGMKELDFSLLLCSIEKGICVPPETCADGAALAGFAWPVMLRSARQRDCPGQPAPLASSAFAYSSTSSSHVRYCLLPFARAK
jgi:hypothetical protein